MLQALSSRREFLTRGRPEFEVRLEPELVAEAVSAALPAADPSLRRAYRREANGIDRSPGFEERFRELDSKFFSSLGLKHALTEAAAPFRSVLLERPCVVVRAPTPDGEAADLAEFDGQPSVCLALSPTRFADADSLRRLIGHELAHIEDILDPSFGYDRYCPFPGRSRPEQDRSRARFRLLWGASIDGRLPGRGCLPLLSRADWLEQARALFPRALASEVEAEVVRLLEGHRPTQAQLLAVAVTLGEGVPASAKQGEGCPLCRFPTFAWSKEEELKPMVAQIARDVPGWTLADGACAQCLQSYLLPPVGEGRT
jgi:hypothetical protein